MANAKTVILSLVDAAVEELEAARAITDIHANEKATKEATGYLEAANALMSRHGELYNELIEHPTFMRARKLARLGGFF